MQFRKRTNGDYPISEQQIYVANPNVSRLDTGITINQANHLGYDFVEQTEPPIADFGFNVLPDGVEQVAGVWRTKWKQVPMSEGQIAELVAERIDSLWVAADAYTAGYISGVAIGLLTVGVLQSKPKALAITAWSSAVWGEYYARKASVHLGGPLNLDFSSLGPMPYSVPELQAELSM